MEESGIEQYQYQYAFVASWTLYKGLVLHSIGELTGRTYDSSSLSLGWIP